jgi:catalase (peroxidase I)
MGQSPVRISFRAGERERREGLVHDFVATSTKVMNFDRFELA